MEIDVNIVQMEPKLLDKDANLAKMEWFIKKIYHILLLLLKKKIKDPKRTKT